MVKTGSEARRLYSQHLRGCFPSRPEAEVDAVSALASAAVTVVGAGAATPALVAGLASSGIGKIRLLGDAPVQSTHVQHSRFLRRADVSKPMSDALRARALPPGYEGELDATAALPETKIDLQRELRGASFVVAVVTGPILFPPWMDVLNEATQDAGIPWTSAAVLEGTELHVGPTIVPGKTACYKCFELRFKSNIPSIEPYLRFEAFIRETGESRDFGLLPPLADIAGGLAAAETISALHPHRAPRTLGKLLTFHANSYSIDEHPVLRLPRCPSCTPVMNGPARREWS